MSRQHILTAVITDKKGRVISIGKNSYVKTHPLQACHARKMGKPDSIFLHAEVHAILKCRDLSSAHKIFISRFDVNGNPRLAKPCPICNSAIKEAGIKHIEWTVDKSETF